MSMQRYQQKTYSFRESTHTVMMSMQQKCSTKNRPCKRHRPLGKQQLQNKQMRMSDPPVKIFSNDILHHIMDFFFSERGLVDANSIRSAMQVSKLWYDVCSSSSLWKIPHQGASLKGLHSTWEATNRETKIPAENALRIQSIGDDCSKLIGFAKLEKVTDTQGRVLFRAKERSSATLYLIELISVNKATNIDINHAFEASFFQGDKCPDEVSIGLRQEYPAVVEVVGEHFVRVYENRDKPSVLPVPYFNMSAPMALFSVSSGDRALLRRDPEHLTHLESLHFDSSFLLKRNHWGKIVDWLVEITYCFDLDRRTPFHAMALFQSFVWFSEMADIVNPVPVEKYQLLASACMSISSKCHMGAMQPRDFCICSDRLFTESQLRKAEELIVSIPRCRLGLVTILDFVHSYARTPALRVHELEEELLFYFSELALQSQIQRDLSISRIGACIIILARFCLQIAGLPLWTAEFDQIFGCNFDTVCDGVIRLTTRLEEIRIGEPELTTIESRHRRKREIANLVIPTITSPAVLIAHQARTTQETRTE